MPWIDPVPHKCEKPYADRDDHGRRWECDECAQIWLWNATMFGRFWSRVEPDDEARAAEIVDAEVIAGYVVGRVDETGLQWLHSDIHREYDDASVRCIQLGAADNAVYEIREAHTDGR